MTVCLTIRPSVCLSVKVHKINCNNARPVIMFIIQVLTSTCYYHRYCFSKCRYNSLGDEQAHFHGPNTPGYKQTVNNSHNKPSPSTPWHLQGPNTRGPGPNPVNCAYRQLQQNKLLIHIYIFKEYRDKKIMTKIIYKIIQTMQSPLPYTQCPSTCRFFGK